MNPTLYELTTDWDEKEAMCDRERPEEVEPDELEVELDEN